MPSQIKPTALPKAGYAYQDLVGLRLLIDWLRDPQRFVWVQLECDDADDHSVRGLDDIVAKHSDGNYVLHQVKFTTDPEREDLALSFEWLLKKRPNGKSLIQKWSATALNMMENGGVSDARLQTNRKPDPIFAKALVKQKIKPDKIPIDIRERIIKQIGSKEKVEKFFNQFLFEYDLPWIEDLEHQLYSELVPDYTNDEGWLRLKQEVQRWSTFRNRPAPNGRITLFHIRSQLSTKRPRPIPQDFSVPDGYRPPDAAFHDQVLERTKNPGVVVIWGTPGRGKSTCLSHLAQILAKDGVPVVRHHYFLDLQDATSDRISFVTAANSLQSQLRRLFRKSTQQLQTDVESLHDWLEVCAQVASDAGKTLILIIDGLDHVWRERGNISQLDHLFNRILPLPPNVLLIVGTQKVPSSQLPSRLPTHASGEDWWELPQMDLAAVRSWLGALASNSLFEVPVDEEQSNRILDRLAKSFHKHSGGHPLHLFYSLQSLIRQGREINEDNIEQLPICPEGNIREYYNGLWKRLTKEAAELLHLFAATEFHWPDENSLYACLGNDRVYFEAYEQIAHLVEARRSGLVPFHSSVLVHIRDRSDHAAAADRLLPKVLHWLSTEAPLYWQWGWTWQIRARLGDPTPLIEGPNREWAIDALCNGYPPDHIEAIIAEAEHAALDTMRLADLVRLKLLQARLWNGPEFQTDKFDDFLECALASASDLYGLDWRADNLNTLPDAILPVVARLLRQSRPNIPQRCLNEMNRRLRYAFEFEDEHFGDAEADAFATLKTVAATSEASFIRAVKFARQFRRQTQLFRSFAQHAISSGNGLQLFDIWQSDDLTTDLAKELANSCVRFACLEGIDLSNRNEASFISSYPLGRCFALTQGIRTNSFPVPFDKLSQNFLFYEDKGFILHNHFFCSLATALEAVGSFDFIKREKPKNTSEFIYEVFDQLDIAARNIAQRLRLRTGDLGPFAIYALIDQLDQPDWASDHSTGDVRRLLSSALPLISFDLMLLGLSIDRGSEHSVEEYTQLEELQWWNEILWLDHILDNGIDILPDAILSNVIKRQKGEIENKVNEITERTDDYIRLVRLSMLANLNDLSREFLRCAAQCILGYGWRKDVTIFDTFNAIEACADMDAGDVRGWLERLQPIVYEILEFTDGSETNHAPPEFLELVGKYAPDRLAHCHYHYIERQELNYTEDTQGVAIRHISLSDPLAVAFIRCQLTTSALTELSKRKEDGDVDAAQLLDDQISLLGGKPYKKSSPRSQRKSKQMKNRSKSVIQKYKPNQFEKFLNDAKIKFHYDRDEDLTNWIEYWAKKGKSQEILSEFDRLYETTDVSRYFEREIDQIFELSLRTEGKNAAYKWLIRSMKANYGWSRYYVSGSIDRLRLAAKTYPSKWEDFVRDAAAGRSSGLDTKKGVVVGTDLLVVFLVSVGQLDQAVAVTEAMLQSLEDDVRALPISHAAWDPAPSSPKIDIFGFLLAQLRWPDSMSRLVAAREISNLLKADNAGELRDRFLSWMSGRNLETELSVALGIVGLAGGQQVFDGSKVRASITHPTILSDEIFETIYGQPISIKTWMTAHSGPPQYGFSAEKGFERAHKSCGLLYSGIFQALEASSGLPFLEQWAWEWHCMMKREDFHSFDPVYFFPSPDRKRYTGSFEPRECDILHSAWLRTLSYAVAQWGMPIEHALHQALDANRLNLDLAKLQPTKSPRYWPNYSSKSRASKLTTERGVKELVARVSNQKRNFVVAASGPVCQTQNLMADFDYRIGICDQNETFTPEEMFDLFDPFLQATPNHLPLQFRGGIGTEEIVAKTKGLLSSKSSPAAFQLHTNAVARWHFDLIFRGLFWPAPWLIGEAATARVDNDKLTFEKSGSSVARLIYWLQRWRPAYLRDLKPLLGSALILDRQIADRWAARENKILYGVGKLSIAERETDYGEFTKRVITASRAL